MKFTLTVDDANRLYTHSRAERLASNTREDLKLIQCHIEDGTLTASFINLFSCAQLHCPVKNADSTGTCFIMPPTHKFSKADSFVDIIDEKNMTTYNTSQTSYSVRKPECMPEAIDTKRWLSHETQHSIWFNSSLLLDALSAYKGDKIVKLDFLGETTGLYIRNEREDISYVLPIKPPKK